MKHIPNVLTIVRIAVTPVMLAFLLADTVPGMVVALVLFTIAAASDYLDGKIARDYQARSRLGQFLDPLADKVLVLSTFVAIAFMVPKVVAGWGVVLIALRDGAVTGLRYHARAKGTSLRTLPVAKAKTAVQVTYLFAMLLLLTVGKLQGVAAEAARSALDGSVPHGAFLLVVAFTLWTGLTYFFPYIFRKSASLQ